PRAAGDNGGVHSLRDGTGRVEPRGDLAMQNVLDLLAAGEVPDQIDLDAIGNDDWSGDASEIRHFPHLLEIVQVSCTCTAHQIVRATVDCIVYTSRVACFRPRSC